MRMIRSLKAAIGFSTLLLAAGLFTTGCQHRAPAASQLSGRFTLATVDGKPVPAEVKHGSSPVQVRSGWFKFEPDGTCSTLTVFARPAGKEVKREVSATYTVDGQNVAMKWKGAGRTTGKIEGDTFTMNNEGMIFVYRK